MKTKKTDKHLENMRFVIERINGINDWRNEAVKHAVNEQQKNDIELTALQLLKAIQWSY